VYQWIEKTYEELFQTQELPRPPLPTPRPLLGEVPETLTVLLGVTHLHEDMKNYLKEMNRGLKRMKRKPKHGKDSKE
jgi:hypothetical protein